MEGGTRRLTDRQWDGWGGTIGDGSGTLRTVPNRFRTVPNRSNCPATPSLLDQVIRKHSLHPSGHEVGHAEDEGGNHYDGEADQGRAYEEVRTGDAEASEDYGDQGIYQEESENCAHNSSHKAHGEEGQGQLEPELTAGEAHRLFDAKLLLLTDKDGFQQELDHQVNDRHIYKDQQQDEQQRCEHGECQPSP